MQGCMHVCRPRRCPCQVGLMTDCEWPPWLAHGNSNPLSYSAGAILEAKKQRSAIMGTTGRESGDKRV